MTDATLVPRDHDEKPTYMDLARLAWEISWGESTIELACKEGKFPQPRKKRGKRVWKFKEVEAWLDADETVVPISEAERIREAARKVQHG